MSLNTLAFSYSPATSVGAVYMSRWPQPWLNAGGRGRRCRWRRGSRAGRAPGPCVRVRSLPGAGSSPRHAAADLNRRRQDAAQGFFDDGLSLLDDERRLAFRRHAAHEFLRKRVLRYFEHRVRASVGVVLHEGSCRQCLQAMMPSDLSSASA